MTGREDTRVVRQSALADTRAGDRGKSAQVIVLTGRRAGHRMVMESAIVVGRGGDVDLSCDGEDTVSRRHARISKLPDSTWELQDLGSINGTSVNGTPVRSATLRFGDKIRLGPRVVLMFGRHDPLEDQLLQSQRLQLVGELSARVAHDFNNVLGSILANAFLAEEATSREDLRECLRDVQAATRRGATLAKQLTAFAAPPREQSAVADVKAIVTEVHSLLRRTAAGSVDISIDIDDGLSVACHPSALVQVLLNLGVNAVDAMPHGGRLWFTACVEPRPSELGGDPTVSNFVRISVEDTGAGIEAAALERVFDPFFTTKPLGKGTGLGLATVSRIVSDHGGLVKVESSPGRGTRFDVLLPRTEFQADVSVEGRAPEQHEPIQGTVLVVDDDSLIRNALARILSRRGLEVLTAGDASEAMDAFRRHRDAIDLVVLDLDLPGVPGEQLCRDLHSLSRDLRVLVASGTSDPGRFEGLRNYGAHAHLQKPFDGNVLARAVASLLREKVGLPRAVTRRGPSRRECPS